jgi:CRP/FNR family cyclic AMP-dependent transcriptional regulator
MQGASPAAARRDLQHGTTRRRPMSAGTTRPDRDARFTQLAPRLAEVTLDVRAGVWDPRTTWDAGRGWFTVLVLDGLLVGEASLDGVAAAHLRMAGDLVDPVAPREHVLSSEAVTWRVLEDARLAILGRRFLAATREHPGLTLALYRRQADQLDRAFRLAALTQLPRVEQRIVALFRALGDERGRIVPTGVVVDLPVTHEGIGRLVGAKRPTVSLALKQLDREGILGRRGSRWFIDRRATALAGDVGPLPTLAA